MDALRPIEIATAAPAPTLAPGPAMPPESPLAMPVQALSRWSRAEERPPAASDPYRAPWLARLFVFAGAAALTAYGAYEMYQVVSVSRTTVLQWLLLLLFTVNFSWIALAFTSGLLGFVSLLRRPRRLPPLPETLRSRTAVVMPVYNESTARTFAFRPSSNRRMVSRVKDSSSTNRMSAPLRSPSLGSTMPAGSSSTSCWASGRVTENFAPLPSPSLSTLMSPP